MMSIERVKQRNFMMHLHQQKGQGVPIVPRFDDRYMTAIFNKSSGIDILFYS